MLNIYTVQTQAPHALISTLCFLGQQQACVQEQPQHIVSLHASHSPLLYQPLQKHMEQIKVCQW